MTDVLVKPAFVSALPDTGDTTRLGPNAWNAARLFSAGALGDLLYRDTGSATGASWLADVAIGSVLVSGGVGAAPAWSALSGLAITEAQITDGTLLARLAAAETVTAAWAFQRNAIAVTSTDGIALANDTSATSGVPVQQSPRLRFRSNVWNTTAVAANNTDDWFIESVPVSGTTPSGLLKFGKSLNGGATTFPLTLSSDGQLTTLSSVTSGGGINSTGHVTFIAKTDLWSPANGQLNILNNANTAGIGLDVTTDGVAVFRTRDQNAYATVDCLGLKASGAAGATFSGAITNLTVVNGVVTAAS